MILKLTGKRQYNIEKEDSTENYIIESFETDYIGNISKVKRSVPGNHRKDNNENLTIDFNDGSQMCLVIGEFKNGTYYPCYKNVFLMNDEGKTIERLI